MPQKTWAVGEEVLAADWNLYAQNQVVPQFTGTTQRDAQWPSPPNGAMCVTTDTYTVWLRVAGAWSRQGAGGALASVTSATATALSPTPIDLPLSASNPIIANRKIRVESVCQFGSAAAVAAGLVTLAVQIDGVDMTNGPRVSAINAGPTGVTFSTQAFATGPSAATHTFKARASCTVASGVYFQFGSLSVVDEGPV